MNLDMINQFLIFFLSPTPFSVFLFFRILIATYPPPHYSSLSHCETSLLSSWIYYIRERERDIVSWPWNGGSNVVGIDTLLIHLIKIIFDHHLLF